MPNSRRKKKSKLYSAIGAALVAVLALAYYFLDDGAIPLIREENGIAPEFLSGIGPEGIGGDAILNRLKNRTTIPDEVSDYTVAQLIAIPNDVLYQEGRRRREKWYPSAKLYAEKIETRGSRVTGYLLRAKQSGIESANGYIDSLRDYHLWIADDSVADRRRTMIAEITPRWKTVFPEWRLRTFKRLADQKARVRVTGWLLWDNVHASDVNKSRGTQWEVHPVTKFEVFTGGEWRDLQVLPEDRGVPVL